MKYIQTNYEIHETKCINSVISDSMYEKMYDPNVHELDEKNITIIDINDVKQAINNMLDKTVKQYQKKFNRL